MQKKLYAEVKLVVAEVSKAEGFDLVQDSAFLPHTANKSILYFSDKVPDITDKVLARLNADAPTEAVEESTKKKATGDDKASSGNDKKSTSKK